MLKYKDQKQACKHCGYEKPKEEMYAAQNTSDGRHGACIQCLRSLGKLPDPGKATKISKEIDMVGVRARIGYENTAHGPFPVVPKSIAKTSEARKRVKPCR